MSRQKDQMRATLLSGLESEDAALLERFGATKEVRRERAVKGGRKAAVRAATAKARPREKAAAPIEVRLSRLEEAVLEMRRDALREAGTQVSKRALLRVAVQLLEAMPLGELEARVARLSRLKKS